MKSTAAFCGLTAALCSALAPTAALAVTTCSELPIASVTAIGNDGNVPENTLDESLSTRWSNLGIGSWITYDLGRVQTVDAANIAWYQGDTRVNNFALSVSTDGTTFTQVQSGQSSGLGTGFELTSLPAPVSARYVRITVNGNTVNDWASITEARACGTASVPSCQPLPVAAVTAIGDDGNVPANTLDGNFGSRWSNLGVGSWIDFDLGQAQSVGGAAIAWYKGNTRVNSFALSASSDGATFTQVASGQSSGVSTDYELTSFAAPATARYLRLTVNGNTMNNWASVTETRVCAAGSPPPPPAVDAFGIKMIYPTKAGGERWSMNMASANADPRFNPQGTITQNADGSWKIQDTSTRLLVFTSTGYNQASIASYDPDVLQQQGYMQAANDWRNVEMTGYVRVNAASVNDSYTWYARGGRHNDLAPCEGTAYKGDLFFDGGARVAKESWHVNYDFSSMGAGPANRNQWIGFKMALYNLVEAGKLVAHVELYVNTNLDKTTWTKLYDFKDDGTWAGEMRVKCGGSDALMPITWGGPIATFRWDNASDVDFKWLSVREIQVP